MTIPRESHLRMMPHHCSAACAFQAIHPDLRGGGAGRARAGATWRRGGGTHRAPGWDDGDRQHQVAPDALVDAGRVGERDPLPVELVVWHPPDKREVSVEAAKVDRAHKILVADIDRNGTHRELLAAFQAELEDCNAADPGELRSVINITAIGEMSDTKHRCGA